jgi:AraC-like DNA-binding protein/mannose-6-phosphate isomerase-like protein (cupin superfamily)
MIKSKRRPSGYLKNLIANMQVQVSVAKYSRANPALWRQLDFVPDINRFYFIRKGEGCLEIDGKTYYPKPGQLFVMPAGIRQSYYAISEHSFEKYWCHFTATIGDKNWFQILNLPHFIDVREEEVLERLFQQLIEQYRSGSLTSVLLQRAILMEIIGLFIESAFQQERYFLDAADSLPMEKINALFRYIEQHLDQNITVNDLAEVVHFHPNYLIRFFREMVGSSPIQYINHLKMDKAKHLLITTDLPVSKIAHSLGLELYYFSRVFKSHTGLSPTAFRRMLLES